MYAIDLIRRVFPSRQLSYPVYPTRRLLRPQRRQDTACSPPAVPKPKQTVFAWRGAGAAKLFALGTQMPRGPKGEKRAPDVIGNAVHVMRIATGKFDETGMRALVAALTLLLLALPAQAQQVSTGIPKIQNDKAQKTAPRPKADDKAYGNALGNLPDKKYDPWKDMR